MLVVASMLPNVMIDVLGSAAKAAAAAAAAAAACCGRSSLGALLRFTVDI